MVLFQRRAILRRPALRTLALMDCRGHVHGTCSERVASILTAFHGQLAKVRICTFTSPKTDFAPVDGRQALDILMHMPVQTWRY